MNYAVILAGGTGTRFWPLSREALPKQFLKINSSDSFLKSTVSRLRPVIQEQNIYIITNKMYLKQIQRQLKGFRIPGKNIILEPHPLNTLPSIAMAAQIILRKDSQASMLVLPSDHFIKKEKEFREAVSKALGLAERGLFCLIGIKPTRPDSGYGYIKAGREILKDVFFVDKFNEKPKKDLVKKLFKQKNVFWNSGIFCFRAETILQQVRLKKNKLYRQISRIKNEKQIEKCWHGIKPISIDYGILEKTRGMIVIRAKFYWRDLGTWDSLIEVLPKDKNHNSIFANACTLNCADNLIYSQYAKRTIATLGVRDLIIIDTQDALLVCKKNDSQKVKHLVKSLKRKRIQCV